MNKKISLAAIVFMVAAMNVFTGCVDSKAVQIAKKSDFSHVGVDANLGTLVKGYFHGAKWSSSTAEDGKTYVEVKGRCQKKDETVDVLLKYKVDMQEEKISFARLEYNEKPKTVFDYLLLFVDMCKASGKNVEPSAELVKKFDDLGDGLLDFGASLTDFGKTLSDSVNNSMKDLDSKMEDLGSKVESLGSNLESSIENAFESLGSSFNGLFGN